MPVHSVLDFGVDLLGEVDEKTQVERDEK